LATNTTPYGPADEGMHEPTKERFFSESAYFAVYDASSGVGGMMRVAHRVNDGYAEMTLNLPMPDGTVVFDYKRTDIVTDQFFKAATMEIECTEPLQTVRLSYEDDAVLLKDPTLLATNTRRAMREEPRIKTEVDFTYQALHPNIEKITATGDLSSGELPLARDHFEQFGIITGTVKVGDNTYKIERGLTMRDHSWGPREWVSPVYWRQALPMMEDGTCVSASRIGLSETEAATGGLIIDPDGTTHAGGVTRIETEQEYKGAPTFEGGYTVDLETEDGSSFHADATVLAFIPLRHRHPDTDNVMRVGQALCKFESDGRVGYGWTDFWKRLDGGDPWATA
jgi:hypothetical protein